MRWPVLKRRAQRIAWANVLWPNASTLLIALVVSAVLLGLFRIRSRASCMDRVTLKRQKYSCFLPQVVDDGVVTRLTAVVYASNSRQQSVNHLFQRLSDDIIDEIIICSDDQNQDSLEMWARSFKSLRHFIFYTNGLGPHSCFNRAMRSSSATNFLLLTEASVLPVDSSWLRTGMDLLSRDKELGIIGGGTGHIWENGETYEFGEQESVFSAKKAGPLTRLIPFFSNESNSAFMYVECASSLPLIVNSRVNRFVSGFDLTALGVVTPCQLSLDVWAAGMKVGLIGSDIADTEERDPVQIGKQLRRNLKDQDRSEILDQIRALNHKTLDSRSFSQNL
mmetsp:Transcript_2457/g.7332  ORF Transcript_2457/g.7332 Transcript_2457/m.7332 type:complete len:336 (+) Transcript_2457:88-1095(+)